MASQIEPLMLGSDDADSKNVLYLRLRAKGRHYHAKVPILNRLPFPSIAIISLLVVVNLSIWIAVGIVLVSFSMYIFWNSKLI